jgi:hypothetical protein
VKPPITRIISPDTTDLAVENRTADKRVPDPLLFVPVEDTKHP